MKIDLGCGARKVSPEYVGVDKRYCPGVDVRLDLENGTLPFNTNSADEVHASHVFEHISNYLPLVEEVWRVLKPGGRLFVRAPNYKHENAYTDPTHIRMFTPKSFHFFDSRKVPYKESGWLLSVARFSVDDVHMGEMEIRYELTAQKKRILMVAPPSSIHTARWKEYLSRLGHDVKVAARKLKGVADISLAVDGLGKEEQIDKMPEVLQATSERYDVVHAHFATRYGHVLKGVHEGARRILSIWGEDALEEAEKDAQKKARLIVGLGAANSITTTSRYVAEQVAARYGTTPERIWTFPWGYKRSTFFEKRVTDDRKLREWGLSRDGKVVLSARACRQQNNIETILNVFVRSGIDAQLVVLTGDLVDEGYAAKLRLQSSDKIIFLKTVGEEELALLYNRAEATISIPDIDNLSTTVLESLACGTPVICSNIPTYKERIHDGKNGMLVNHCDKDALAEAIRRCVMDDFKSAAKEAAKESVKLDSWEDNARCMISLYDRPQDDGE